MPASPPSDRLALLTGLMEHHGPGPHENGTPQAVHAGGRHYGIGAVAAWNGEPKKGSGPSAPMVIDAAVYLAAAGGDRVLAADKIGQDFYLATGVTLSVDHATLQDHPAALEELARVGNTMHVLIRKYPEVVSSGALKDIALSKYDAALGGTSGRIALGVYEGRYQRISIRAGLDKFESSVEWSTGARNPDGEIEGTVVHEFGHAYQAALLAPLRGKDTIWNGDPDTLFWSHKTGVPFGPTNAMGDAPHLGRALNAVYAFYVGNWKIPRVSMYARTSPVESFAEGFAAREYGYGASADSRFVAAHERLSAWVRDSANAGILRGMDDKLRGAMGSSTYQRRYLDVARAVLGKNATHEQVMFMADLMAGGEEVWGNTSTYRSHGTRGDTEDFARRMSGRDNSPVKKGRPSGMIESVAALLEHLGPGPHPNGSPQSVHGRGGSARGPMRDIAPPGSGVADFNAWENIDMIIMSMSASEAKDMTVTALSKAAGVSYDLANRFVKQWAGSANDSDLRSLSIQRDAALEFGVEMSPWQKDHLAKAEAEAARVARVLPLVGKISALRGANDDAKGKDLAWLLDRAGVSWADAEEMYRIGWKEMYPHLPERLASDGWERLAKSDGPTGRIGFVAMLTATENYGNQARWYPLADSATQRRILRAMYNITQERLAGVDGMILYRGAGSGATDGENHGMSVPARMGALSSWTANGSTAYDFARGKGVKGSVATAYIPRERVLSFPSTGLGALDEYEYVVIGGGVFNVELTQAILWRDTGMEY